MKDDFNRAMGGEDLGVRLEVALAEGQRLREEHREAFARLHRSVDSLSRFIFTKSDAECIVAMRHSGCSQPASPSA